MIKYISYKNLKFYHNTVEHGIIVVMSIPLLIYFNHTHSRNSNIFMLSIIAPLSVHAQWAYTGTLGSFHHREKHRNESDLIRNFAQTLPAQLRNANHRNSTGVYNINTEVNSTLQYTEVSKDFVCCCILYFLAQWIPFRSSKHTCLQLQHFSLIYYRNCKINHENTFSLLLRLP
jgi:prolipoprotein diacylglyceryltransferase